MHLLFVVDNHNGSNPLATPSCSSSEKCLHGDNHRLSHTGVFSSIFFTSSNQCSICLSHFPRFFITSVRATWFRDDVVCKCSSVKVVDRLNAVFQSQRHVRSWACKIVAWKVFLFQVIWGNPSWFFCQGISPLMRCIESLRLPESLGDQTGRQSENPRGTLLVVPRCVLPTTSSSLLYVQLL